MSDQGAKTYVRVCVKCREPGEPKEPMEARAGARLMRALAARGGVDYALVEVACFNVCNRAVTIAFSARGKWTYLFGGFSAAGGAAMDQTAAEIAAAARAYAASPDGFIPIDDRSPFLRGALIARTPPVA